MNNFIVIEVGSTVTKVYQYLNGEIITHPSKTIGFKPHLKNGKLDANDVKTLIDYCLELKKITDKIFVYGTSIFRVLEEKEKTKFLKNFELKTGLQFNIVTAEQEALYTVSGVTLSNDYTGRLAVMIGGGGSVEVIVVENKKIIEKHLNNFGSVNINEKFKNINDLHPKLKVEDIYKFCDKNIANVENKCEILVTSGGDTKYCQESMASEYLVPNTFYSDPHQPHMIKVSDYLKANKKFILKQNINVYKKFSVYQNDWWNYARSYNCCIACAAKKVGAVYEIPSKINMCLGIINELKEK